MLEGLSFGWRSAVLSVAAAQLLFLAVALLRPVQNRNANRALAALLVIAVGVFTPWLIGFAGFYDKWRWLSFAPFSITLAIAPLFYLYVNGLTRGVLPERALLHLAPAALQFGYLALCFVALRQPFKNEWLSTQSDIYGFLTGAGVIVGCVHYGLKCQYLLRRYRTRLAQERSDDHRYAAEWISRSIGALFIFLTLFAAYEVWNLFDPLGYRGLMGLYLGVAAFALYLAVEGWRHAALAFPKMELAAQPEASAPEARDWSVQGIQWAEAVRNARWHADPELSLADLARRLGTNTNYLSRALNEGLGVNFATFINGLRSDNVASLIRAGDRRDLLDLALEAGFSSKASFNRAFAARFGVSPSAYRRAQASNQEKSAN